MPLNIKKLIKYNQINSNYDDGVRCGVRYVLLTGAVDCSVGERVISVSSYGRVMRLETT